MHSDDQRDEAAEGGGQYAVSANDPGGYPLVAGSDEDRTFATSDELMARFPGMERETAQALVGEADDSYPLAERGDLGLFTRQHRNPVSGTLDGESTCRVTRRDDGRYQVVFVALHEPAADEHEAALYEGMRVCPVPAAEGGGSAVWIFNPAGVAEGGYRWAPDAEQLAGFGRQVAEAERAGAEAG